MVPQKVVHQEVTLVLAAPVLEVPEAQVVHHLAHLDYLLPDSLFPVYSFQHNKVLHQDPEDQVPVLFLLAVLQVVILHLLKVMKNLKKNQPKPNQKLNPKRENQRSKFEHLTVTPF
jgi:hypothetical protein